MRLIQDVYSKKLLQEALDPVDAVELQKPIAPHDEQYSDVFCRPRRNRRALAQVPHLGLVWEMTARLCTIEPCTQTPPVRVLRGYARKQLALHHELCKKAKNDKLPVPPQWVISPGSPRAGLAALPAAPAAGWSPGFYRSGALLEQWIVVLAELPKTAETRLLRMMGPPVMRRTAMAEIAALTMDDPARRPWIEILDDLVYFLVKKIDVSSTRPTQELVDMTELHREFEQFKAELRRESRAAGHTEGRAEGRAEGLQEGTAKGKAEALLAIFAARRFVVSSRVRNKILTCRDHALLDRWLTQAMTASSAAKVITASA